MPMHQKIWTVDYLSTRVQVYYPVTLFHCIYFAILSCIMLTHFINVNFKKTVDLNRMPEIL